MRRSLCPRLPACLPVSLAGLHGELSCGADAPLSLWGQTMSDSERPRRRPASRRNDLPEAVRLPLVLAAVAVLLLGCTAGPLIILGRFGPWFGLLASLAAFPVWVYLGPPPMPGLLNGVVCLSGLAAIAGVFLV